MSSQTHFVAMALQKAGVTIPAVPKPAGQTVRQEAALEFGLSLRLCHIDTDSGSVTRRR